MDNQLSDTTNLHVHGLHVSPQGNSDNVLVAIEPGTTFEYEYQLPRIIRPVCTGITRTTMATLPNRCSVACTGPSS